MAVVVSHAMRRYPTSPPGSSYSSHCLGGEGSFQDTWSRDEVSESSLSRSMRYAEPWLYGSVRAPGGLLLAPALVLCSCSEYLNGTKRPSKKGPSLCKKCKGTRLPLSSSDTLRASSKFGTVRCYPTTPAIATASPPIRPGTMRPTSSYTRPSILPTADPYELMRRSRMSPENGTHFRIRSTSPSKTSRNEAPPAPKTPPKRSAAEQKLPSSNGRKPILERDINPSSNGRKSILECDINPYDLMSLEDAKKDANVALVGGQRVRIRPPLAEQVYEEVKAQPSRQPSQIPKLKGPAANKAKGPPKSNEKESESNRFKSILKKPTTFSDTDSSGGPERSPSPAQKSGSHFYLPMPMNTPRKKVQFLVENELVCHKQVDRKDSAKTDKVVERNDDAPPEEEANIYEEVPECVEVPETNERKSFTLRRSVSERLIQESTKVVFHDTMALRSRSRRSDSRRAFSAVTDLQRLDGVAFQTSSDSPPELEPTPSSPTTALEEPFETPPENPKGGKTALNEVTPIITEAEINTTNSTDDAVNNQNKSVDTTNKVNDTSVPIKIEEIKKAEVEEVLDTPPVVPPRKKSSSKQPCVIKIDTSPKRDVQTLKVETPSPTQTLDYHNKTVVQIRVPSAVHKIQIRNEFPESLNNVQTLTIGDNAQRKTSIMINGDDCYSTINVNDDVPMYQSSVVVKDTGSDMDLKLNRSSSVYISGNFVNAVQDSPTVPNISKQFLETPKYNSVIVSSAQPEKFNELSTKEYQSPETASSSASPPELVQIETQKLLQEDSSITEEEELKKLLKDPVEAVKRNLVPHVCGRSDVSRRPRDKKLNNFTASLLENHVETNIAKLIEDSLLKLRNYESVEDDDRDICSEHSSSTQYEAMDPGSDCYTDNSNRSSVTEEELNARTKFYELLADSAIAEISENEDHHYESIRLNADPIYEEISPPPLPSNPPPSNIIDDLQLDKQFTTRSIFEGASKYDILSYLVDAKERGIVQEDSYNFGNTDVIIEEDVKDVTEPFRVSHMSSVSDSSEDSSLVITNGMPEDKSVKSAEVERNDSGVGSETSKSSLIRFRAKSELSLNCEDCETTIEPSESDPLLCRKCVKKRSERKEIITEIVETEEKYSRDLQIILEEFYQPMLVAGLLTPDQLSAIFLNAEELLENSQALAERLRDAVEIATEQGDEDLLTVNIGKLFLEAAPMLHAFETYCIRQGNASLLLASLEKDKELLRIFLRVSQMENTMLRRMNLNSFLMVPVQRVTKYPLLLTRLYKSTPSHHETREQLKEAQHKIELHLNHMNSETKDVPSKLWRRIGSNSGRRSSSEMDLVSIKLRKIAVDVLEWNHDEAKFALEGKLLFTQPTDNNWRKGRTIKLAPINALLVTNGKQTSTNRTDEEGLCFPKNGIREAALLLVRDKNGRYSLLREPLYLDRCIIATDPAWQSYFEVQEVIGKDTFIFKAEDDELTKKWYRQLQYHAQGLGGWRKRRNALANIMINGMGLRS